MIRALKVTHISSAHRRDDIRIFLKMARSAAAMGHDITFVVADDRGDEIADNVKILGVGKAKSRLARMSQSPKLVLKKALSTQADIYHFHDPELLMIAKALKGTGAKVVMDAHEDTEKQILAKPYLPSFARPIISSIFQLYEGHVLRHIDLVIAATDSICNKYKANGILAIAVKNYPIIGELALQDIDYSVKKAVICYVGGISEPRGYYEMVEAAKIGNNKFTIKFAGNLMTKEISEKVQSFSSNTMEFFGYLDREGIKALFDESSAGLVTLHPTPNHLESLPIKMFEYMSAGLPVIASNFPFWKDIIQDAQCGICVDPHDAVAIAAAINYILDNPKRAREMGLNGQRATIKKYNWSVQAQTMLKAYDQLMMN